MQDYKRVVIKIGTSTLAHPTGLLNIRLMERLIKVVSDLKNSGMEIIIVSSGAIGVGKGKLGSCAGDNFDIPARQACAAVGQGSLMHTYDTMFSVYHHNIAQILLTRDVIEDKERKNNIANTLNRLLEMKCVPIINENDTIATEEIEFGENDILSAMVAAFVHADLLIILTDRDGLYNSHPDNPEADLIKRVTVIDDNIRMMAGSSAPGSLGSGGMITKVEAAAYAAKRGIPTAILNGADPEFIYDLLDGKECGTFFEAQS